MVFASDIKLAHSIFAIPFAAASFFVGKIPIPTWTEVTLLMVAMVSARTFAMGMNRWLDRDIDRLNARTARRAVPAGKLSASACLFWSTLAALIFVPTAFALSPLAGWLSVPLLVLLASYSLMKRVSWLTHFYLGACLGFAPVAVEIALTGQVSWPVIFLALGVTFWTAGFDVIYSLQDERFDIDAGLQSVPSKFGAHAALMISRLSFVLSVAMFCLSGWMSAAGWFYFAGVSLVALILCWEQFHVRHATQGIQEARLNAAFFTANAWVSVVFLTFTVLDFLWGQWS